MDGLHKKILLFSIFYLFLAIFVNYKLHYEETPSFFTPDSNSYFNNTKWFFRGGDFHRPFRFVYPLLSALPYALLRNEWAMLILPLISALISVHFFNLILKLSKFSNFERIIGSSLLIFSSVFTNSATHALTEAPLLTIGMYFLYRWALKKKDYILTATFILGFFTNILMLIFFFATFFSDWLEKKSVKWAMPILIFCIIGSPFFVYRYYAAHIIYPAGGGWVYGSVLERFTFFFKTLFMATEPLLIFSILGVLKVLENKRKPIHNAFVGILISNAIFVFSWPAPDVRFWAISMPAFAFLSTFWMKKLKKVEVVIATTISLWFFKYYAYIGSVMSTMF